MHEWSPERLLRWAADIGSSTREVVTRLLARNKHPEQNYRTVFGLLGLAKKYDRERMNNACGRALLINSPTSQSVKSILKQGLDQVAVETPEKATQQELNLDDHENVRGAGYYN
jgi:hypothetical protein